jgi:hypothetical protein
MLNLTLKTDDLIVFVPLGQHICPDLVAPLPLKGTSKIYKILGKPICLEGDEFPQNLKKPLTYISPPYVIPGQGTLDWKPPASLFSITAKSENKKMVVLPPPFQVEFKVTVPAMQPPPGPGPPVPDGSTTKKFLVQYQSVGAPLVTKK